MDHKRPIALVSLLFLFFLVSTSRGAANVSAIQEKLREIQLKLIKEQIKLIQEKTLDVGRFVASPMVPAPEPVLNRDELALRLENQIRGLNDVVVALRPRVIEEEAVRIERRIAEINEEVKTATGARLRELRDELNLLLRDFTRIQSSLRESLDRSLKEREVQVLQTKIRELQEKVLLLPRTLPVPPPPMGEDGVIKTQVNIIQEQIQALQLKVLREQVKTIQGKIDTIRR